MLTTFYPPFNFGGDGIGVQRLSRALVRRGHRVTVVHDVDAYNALHRETTPLEDPNSDGVVVRSLSTGLKYLSCFLTQQFGRPVVNGRKIRAILEAGNFDVIQFNNTSLIGGPGLLSFGQQSVKVYEAHEHWLVCPTHILWRHNREPCSKRQCLRCSVHHLRPPQLWRYTGFLERQLPYIDAFIAKSEFSRRKHQDFGFNRNMEVVPYFLPDIENSDSVNSASSPHSRPYFLFVGRLERIKGLDEVIPAFGKYDAADLLVAGSGEHGNQLRDLAGENSRIKFLGRLDPKELSRYYRHALALIVPSICFETFGIILIEAFQNGTPVIARRIGPFPELVEKSGAGTLFEHSEELLQAMHRIQYNPAFRDKLIAHATESFSTYWSEDAVVPAYLKVVRQAARRAGNNHVFEALS
jgi:glycosyltransferase involved in cell wall biosynthesis